MEAAIYIESIPFPETRDYVKKVMANEWFYAQRLGLANIGLKKTLGIVPGKNSALAMAEIVDPSTLNNIDNAKK